MYKLRNVVRQTRRVIALRGITPTLKLIPRMAPVKYSLDGYMAMVEGRQISTVEKQTSHKNLYVLIQTLHIFIAP